MEQGQVAIARILKGLTFVCLYAHLRGLTVIFWLGRYQKESPQLHLEAICGLGGICGRGGWEGAAA